ncbi:MAG: MFS transporter [Xanthomonadales bacterium]|nr:MFS transporter [Xanthomonadales bacterium]
MLPMSISTSLYEKLTNEEDARICADIPDEACRATPRSFIFILSAYVLTKLGDAIASPKTTLAWVTTAVGAPGWVLGLLVPIRESGSMIPQLFIGGVIRRLAVRKWVWVAGSIGQCLCIVGIGFAAIYLEGSRAGWAIIVLISLFSAARGFCSVAAKDVLGKTIPRPRRGQLTGWSASIAGLISLGLGVAIILQSQSGLEASTIGLLLIGAGLLWLAASVVYAQVPEYSGETGGGRNAMEALSRLRLLVTDKPFRKFVITRALLMCSALSAPFYVALAQGNQGSRASLLGAFIFAAGLASLLSAPVWGRVADSSSKNVMITAALITSGVGILTFLSHRFAPALTATAWFLPVLYFILSVAHSGVRVGRKTYVVNLGSGNQRTDYVAISNSTIGVLLLLVGSVGALVPFIGNSGIIGLLALMGMGGAILGRTLPETETN